MPTIALSKQQVLNLMEYLRKHELSELDQDTYVTLGQSIGIAAPALIPTIQEGGE